MRLIIHAGTHKTATTSFQRLCTSQSSLLAKGGLLYPSINNSINHNQVAILSQGNYHKRLIKFLQDIYQLAIFNSFHSVLLSAEDLENVLIDIGDAKDLNRIANEIGFQTIEWIFIKRNSFDYLRSIYAELSKHKVCLNFVDLSTVIINKGFINISGLNYHWKFVFDLNKHFSLFSNGISGNSSSYLFSFSDFVSGFPGKNLLSKYVEDKLINQIELSDNSIIKDNVRMSAAEVELRYLFNYFNISFTKENVLKHQKQFEDLIISRLNYIENNSLKIKDLLIKKYT